MSNVHFSSATDEWATPVWLLEELGHEFGPFDLDVCATPANAAADAWFTREQDGLQQAWAARCCWMNPPYGRTIGHWMRRAHESVVVGDCDRVVCLVPARTDTRWWQELVLRHAALVRFLPGRVTFGQAKHSAPFPSAVVVFDRTAQPSLSPLRPRGAEGIGGLKT